MPDGSKVFGKSINTEPEKYFTKETLDKIDEYAKRKFYLRIRRRIRNTLLYKEKVMTLLDIKLLEGKYKGIIYKYGKEGLLKMKILTALCL